VLAIYPRFVVTPGFPFFIKRSVSPDDFVTPPDDDKELLALFQIRCAALAKILFWKIVHFRIAMASCLAYLAILAALAVGGVFLPSADGKPVAMRMSPTAPWGGISEGGGAGRGLSKRGQRWTSRVARRKHGLRAIGGWGIDAVAAPESDDEP
jgi:hypothetical protein